MSVNSRASSCIIPSIIRQWLIIWVTIDGRCIYCGTRKNGAVYMKSIFVLSTLWLNQLMDHCMYKNSMCVSLAIRVSGRRSFIWRRYSPSRKQKEAEKHRLFHSALWALSFCAPYISEHYQRFATRSLPTLPPTQEWPTKTCCKS